jgi:hypothetical protein
MVATYMTQAKDVTYTEPIQDLRPCVISDACYRSELNRVRCARYPLELTTFESK